MSNYDHILNEIRRNLHDGRLAVMVGAGFSKNAEPIRPTVGNFPSWEELTGSLALRLYPEKSDREYVLKRCGATSAALRLAEEFETAFGRPALIQLVRESLQEDNFRPGQLHSELLDLPWSDVFTTNYDQLLERAREHVWRYKYDVVRSIHDLPLARPPRIVKLHGTLPDLRDLVLTEEDFRCFPRRYAPFVGTVQATLCEKGICLIGFSGDDPNFLAWTGWVRDEMQVSTPHSYLFMLSKPKPFQRRLLESRRIIPIYLFQQFDAADAREAFDQLFSFLRKRPEPPTPGWNAGPRYAISRHHATVAPEPFASSDRDWIATAFEWRKHRLEYRGWYVLYKEGIERLWSATRYWSTKLHAADTKEWKPPEAIFVLRELAWRCARALAPLPDDLVEEIIGPALSSYEEWRADRKPRDIAIQAPEEADSIRAAELDAAALFLRMELLRHARETGERVRFEQLSQAISSAAESLTTTEKREVLHFDAHERILFELGSLNHASARQQLRKWRTSRIDAIWALRRAALLLECGESSFGRRIILSILGGLRSPSITDQEDMAARSLEGIAVFLLLCVHHVEEATRGSAKSRTTDIASGVVDSKSTAIKLPPNDDDSADSTTEQSSLSSEAEILDRLSVLRKDGCDPNDTLEWFKTLCEHVIPPPEEVTVRQSFDIGRTQTTHHVGGDDNLWRAYQALRFIDETALPLTIPGVIGLNVAGTLFRNASLMIANISPREAIGLVLRSRHEKLVDQFLTRRQLAELASEQVDFLFASGVEALEGALAHLGTKPPRKHDEDAWWENQFVIACKVLSRVVVAVDDSRVLRILDIVLGLPNDNRIHGRLKPPDELATLIRRCCETLSRDTYAGLLPRLLQTPLPGSDDFPEPATLVGEWYDPVSAVSVHAGLSPAIGGMNIESEINLLLQVISTKAGAWRDNATHRLTKLHDAGLLSRPQQSAFAAALYQRCDAYGLPRGTGCFDALLLSLPRVQGKSEKPLFRQKYLVSDEKPAAFWDELRRTVARFGLPRQPPRRSIQWSRGDINQILDRCTAYVDGMEAAVKDAKDQTQAGAFRDALFGMTERKQDEFHAWLGVIEDLVLLSEAASEDQCKRAHELLQRVERLGKTTVRAYASLTYLEMMNVAESSARIIECLSARDENIVWQACGATARWCELIKADVIAEVPLNLLSALATLVASRRHEKLSLLINTAKDVVDILSDDTPETFIQSVLFGLRGLLEETRYATDSPFSIETKIRLRGACVRLAAGLKSRGVIDAAIDRWIEDAASDLFPEVRRNVEAATAVT